MSPVIISGENNSVMLTTNLKRFFGWHDYMQSRRKVYSCWLNLNCACCWALLSVVWRGQSRGSQLLFRPGML